MPLGYDNSGTGGKARYSETFGDWTSPKDWTKYALRTLTLYFYGALTNAAEQLYVALEDNASQIKVVNHPDPEATQKVGWQEWNIKLSDFSGVNLSAIKKMYIGLGKRTSPQAGGMGTIFIDDMRLYQSRCIPSMGKPAADFSNNCIVDYADLDIMANDWLGGAGLASDLDGDGNVDFADYAKLADAWLKQVLWPNRSVGQSPIGSQVLHHFWACTGHISVGPGCLSQRI